MKIIISFDTITDAMLLESYSKQGDFDGQLVPIPNEISAGCGLAWECDYPSIQELEDLLKKNNLEFFELHILKTEDR